MSLRTAIRRARVEKRMSVAGLAEAVGVNKSYISLIENGKRTPSPSVLSRLSSVLGLSLPVPLDSSKPRGGGRTPSVNVNEKEGMRTPNVNVNTDEILEAIWSLDRNVERLGRQLSRLMEQIGGSDDNC